jgi:nucleoside-diphosphate-sugar epimerase
MRVFLAGATGVIGRYLIPLLHDAGHQVVGTSRTLRGVESLADRGVTGVRVDALDRDGLVRAVAEAGPDVVVHQLTALAERDFAANAHLRREGTANLVAAARAAGVRRIVAQSVAWAYQPGAEPADEDTALDPTTEEPRATTVGGIAALERAVAELPEHVVLRCGMLYGPGTWYADDGLVVDQLRAGELRADDAVTSWLHVHDAAEAAVRALDWPSGAVNVVDDEPAPAREWLPVLAAALDLPAPKPVSGRAGWQRGARNDRARALGWRPSHPTWRAGFRELTPG